MVLTVCPLASGSSGNSIYIGDGKNKILVDCGLSGKKTEELLQSRGISCAELDGIILTHEHSDHIKGAGVLSRRYSLPVFTRPRTWAAGEKVLERIPPSRQKLLLPGLSFGKLELDFFSLPHDAADPVGLVIRWQGKQIAVVTDLGEINGEIEERIRGSDVFIIEANHDPDMLANGPYPPYLKRRIRGPEGHLSNDDCGFLLSRVLDGKPAHIFLAHLSHDNNVPDVARITVENILKDCGWEGEGTLSIAERHCASRPVKVS